MTATLVVAAVATGAGACLQSAGGFGFAMVAGPALFAVLDPAEAVGALLVLGSGLNALVLAGERRRAEVRWRELAPMLAAALPGLVAGVLLLDALSKEALQVLVGAGVLAAVALRGRNPHPAGPASGYPVGFLAGALTTSTSVNGPPLLLWLRARGAQPGELRDSLAASFLGLNVLGVATVALAVGADASPGTDVVLALAPAAAIGHVAGRRLFLRMERPHFEALGTAVVIGAGLASLATAAF